MKFIPIFWALILSSCTLNIIQADTEGNASDVVDAPQDAKADIKTEIPGIL